jgi:hypothetical protein
MEESDLVRLTTKGTLMNQSVQFGYTLGKAGVGTDISDLVDHWITNIVPLLTDATSSSVTWLTVKADYVLDEAPEGIEVAITGTPAGEIIGDCLPPFNSMLISIKTGLKGRRRRGRMFIPGVPEGGSAVGKIAGTPLTGLEALGAGLTSFYALGGSFSPNWQAQVYSPADPDFETKKGVHTRLTSVWTPVQNHVASEFVHSMVSRRIGRGI